jgi:hypothetical protein
LNSATEHEAEIEAGGTGQFDVLADENVIFSKQELGRFPEPGEVRGLLG